MNKNRIIAMSFAILSVITLLYCTQEYHLGFSPDSISYRDAAQKIIEGDVITDRYGNIINRWPPIYSISIAGVSTLFNCGVLEGATYLNCILIFILFLLFNKSIIRFGISVSLQLILNLKLLFSYLFFQYLMYLSESLFLVLILGTYLAFIKWHQNKKMMHLILVGIFSGLMLLTRYAGLGLVAGIVFYFLFTQKGTWKDKIINCLIYSISTGVIFSLWPLYIYSTEAEPISREYVFHMISKENLFSFVTTILNWAYPKQIKLFLLFSFLLLAPLLLKRKEILNRFKVLLPFYKHNLTLLIYMALFYLLFLITTMLFFDAYLSFSQRLMSPIFLLVLIGITPLLQNLLDFKVTKKALSGLLTLVLLSTFFSFPVTYQEFHENGLGYTGKSWQESPIVNSVKGIPSGVIHTNAYDAIYFFYPEFNKNVTVLPFKYYSGTLKKNDKFDEEMKEMVESVENGAIVVYMHCINRDYLANEIDLTSYFDEDQITSFKDGFIIQ